MKTILSALVGFILLVACNNTSQQSVSKQDSSAMQSASKDTSTKMSMSDSSQYTIEMIDNAKDPVCGMPTTTEVGDTVHFKNKVIGFCSKECRDEFMKDAPKSFAFVEWKKIK